MELKPGAVELGGQGGHLPTQFLENKIENCSNLQSIEMKICRVLPTLDTVAHMTNYTWIGPVIIVNSIKILFASYSWYSWSCDHLRLG